MGKYFADEHASPASQLGGEACMLTDDEAVRALRGAETFEALMDLGKALCFQLRYREAIEVYTRAIALAPLEIQGYRQRAARYISTLQPRKAVRDLLRCRQLGGDESDLSYRLGICDYLLGEYGDAMRECAVCHCLNDDEMGVAAIFWHTLSAWRAGAEPVLLKDQYHRGMKVGHHTAYDLCMALAAGHIALPEALERLNGEPSDLEYSIMAYGIAACLRRAGEDTQADGLIDALLKRDGFWISYAYLAAWNDRHNRDSGERHVHA